MNRPLRIAVADDERDTCEFYERFLPRLGYEVACVARNGNELVEQCRLSRPDVVITDVRMPGMDGLEAVESMSREMAVPVIVVTAFADAGWVDRAQAAGVSTYLLKPITEHDLGPAIVLARKQFEQVQALRKEASDLRQSLEDRKLVERAKGVVTRRVGVPEAEAFRRIRKYASDRNMKLAEASRTILDAEDVFRILDNC
jgi:AmiR/NasT family two-component response regulator